MLLPLPAPPDGRLGAVLGEGEANETTTDEKVARTRAAIIMREKRLISWDVDGVPYIMNENGTWIEWEG